MESNTRTDEVLPQIAILSSINLGAGIIEEFIFDKSAELGIPIVIAARDDLPRKVCVTFASASVDWNTAGYGVPNLDPRGFGIVTTDSGAHVRLEPSKCESQNEVCHERARIDPGIHVALC